MAKNFQKIGQKSAKSKFHHDLVNIGEFEDLQIQFLWWNLIKYPKRWPVHIIHKFVPTIYSLKMAKQGPKMAQNSPNMAKIENSHNSVNFHRTVYFKSI
jgi:hypothetical protein